MFVAVRGVNRHGAEFAAAAAEKGAVAVVTDAEGADVAEATGLPVVVVDDPRGMLGDLSAWVYGTGRDDHLPILFGTTGTNGKTSVSHLLEGILGQLGSSPVCPRPRSGTSPGRSSSRASRHPRRTRCTPSSRSCASAASRRSPSR